MRLIFLFMLLAIAGCRIEPDKPRLIIVAPDLSASIEPRARNEAFAAVADLAKLMKRGDRLVVIPITSDSAIDTQGQILRFELPKERQAYDQDIKQFSDKIQKLLGEMARQSALKPSDQTDILGCARVAEQEIAIASKYRPVLVFLSDFIQDSRVADFEKSEKVATPTKGEQFGRSVAAQNSLRLVGIPVYLGWLRSVDLAKFNGDRRGGIEAFWIAYFKASGARPFSAMDGSGLLISFVQESAVNQSLP